jgi:uncharacterized membrane protein
MKPLFYLRKVLLAIWVGKIVFFATSIAPTVFKALSRSDAATLQAQIFPKYFGLGLTATLGIALVTLVSFALGQRSTQTKVLLGCALLAAGIYINLLYFVTPEILRLQPEVLALPKGSTEAIALEFSQIHKISTSLNLVCLILALICLALV